LDTILNIGKTKNPYGLEKPFIPDLIVMVAQTRQQTGGSKTETKPVVEVTNTVSSELANDSHVLMKAPAQVVNQNPAGKIGEREENKKKRIEESIIIISDTDSEADAVCSMKFPDFESFCNARNEMLSNTDDTEDDCIDIATEYSMMVSID
jgi:hypothetical protein